MPSRPAPTSDGIPVATRKARIVGFCLDWLAMTLPLAPFVAVGVSLMRGAQASLQSDGGERWGGTFGDRALLTDLMWKFLLGGGVVFFLLLIYQVRLSLRGQSIGYRVLGLRAVIKGTQRTPEAGRALCRRWGYFGLTVVALLASFFMSDTTTQGVSYLLDLLLFVDVLWILGPARQCLHDKLTGTVVVRTPTLRDFAEAADSP